MKRYRDESGQLAITLDQLKKETAAEAASYYRPGSIYQNAADGREYVYLDPVPGDGELAHFQSFDGYNLFRLIAWVHFFRMWQAKEWN